MKAIPKISDAEFEVMKVAWDKSPTTANEIVARLTACTDWQDKTIRTLINRLLKKGALSHEARGKVYYYSPAVTREACQRRESESFLERVFDGSVMPMLAYFAQSDKLSHEDIEQLKDILDKGG